MKKTLQILLLIISMMSLTQAKSQITGFCFTDVFGYVSEVTATRTAPGYWELVGTADVFAGYDWSSSGYYDKASDIWSLTFTNTEPDGCVTYVEYFTYTSTSYGGGNINFDWTSYCFGGPLGSGTGSTTYTQGACPFRLGDAKEPVGPMSANPEIYNLPAADLHSIEGGSIFGDLFEEETLTVVNTGDNNIGINYELVNDTKVTINIYNQVGQLITNLVNENKIEGYYSTTWNGVNAPNGMYIVELKTDVGSVSSKFVK